MCLYFIDISFNPHNDPGRQVLLLSSSHFTVGEIEADRVNDLPVVTQVLSVGVQTWHARFMVSKHLAYPGDKMGMVKLRKGKAIGCPLQLALYSVVLGKFRENPWPTGKDKMTSPAPSILRS